MIYVETSKSLDQQSTNLWIELTTSIINESQGKSVKSLMD